MLRALFIAHPESIGETYVEHQGVAFSFAVELLTAGFACAVHALVPALFTRTASEAIERLHARLVVARHSKVREPPQPDTLAA